MPCTKMQSNFNERNVNINGEFLNAGGDFESNTNGGAQTMVGQQIRPISIKGKRKQSKTMNISPEHNNLDLQPHHVISVDFDDSMKGTKPNPFNSNNALSKGSFKSSAAR